MQSSLYVGLSAQLALQTRLETIAQNVANSSTNGYRGDEVKFDSVLAGGEAEDKVAFATAGARTIRQTTGPIVRTSNPFDVAVRGDGWISITTAQGRVYTRSGRLQMSATGDLVTATGAQVLDSGGSPIQLDPAAGSPFITRDGSVYQGQRRAGAIGLFSLPAQAQLAHVEGGVVSSIPGAPVTDFSVNGFAQGYVEESNVNPIKEMTRLIAVQREFESLNTVTQQAESSFKNAIQTLGSSS